jgi:hypothetical protein
MTFLPLVTLLSFLDPDQDPLTQLNLCPTRTRITGFKYLSYYSVNRSSELSREEGGEERSSLSLELEGGPARRKVGRTAPPPPQAVDVR